MTKILIIGACGQLGIELTHNLKARYGDDAVIPSDIADKRNVYVDSVFEILDVLDNSNLKRILNYHQISQIYHLAAVLSARGENDPLFAWKLNMDGLLNVLEEARAEKIKRVYWPSSIAVFGPSTPKKMTPQETIANPNTVYGISKLAGERWCQYYHDKYDVDIRSLRYPGLIGWRSKPGGGTTDYAVDIYHKAIGEETFECFLKKDTILPMMYMDDAIRATVELMETDDKNIQVRSSYNISGMSFSPEQIYHSIKGFYPHFEMLYKPDYRQIIAKSWPESIDDTEAREQWGWAPKYDLPMMTEEMLKNLSRPVTAN
ncbi:MAG: NAD-dependent epimerase/dehydratase family protein [Bacteroidetes bacterium]|nr:NAD-dependent epimerase/dehydratase family protein [Bacteroidota bacterium]MDA1120285.1 NAD-dependent epimerase/dehydratase family protein [Bacteroidota bacterium]